jgi:thiol:disulfide interchange protein DsbC
MLTLGRVTQQGVRVLKFMHWMGGVALLLLTGAVSLAAESDNAALRAAISRAYPQVEIEKIVASTQLPGWLEIVTGDRLIYATADGTRIIVGDVVDVATKKSLTEARWTQLLTIDYASLPMNLALTSKTGKGSRELVVFADPLCPYCRELEQKLKSVDNLTVHVFMLPLESVHPGATELAKKIWCSPNRSQAWTAWMRDEVAVPGGAACDTQGLTTIANLGKQLRVAATPTLFFKDGHRVNGLIGPQELETELVAAEHALVVPSGS